MSYPVMLELAGVPVLVVGGGRVALRKVEGLLEGGGMPDVLAPRLEPELARIAVARGLVHLRASFAPGDCAGYRLVVAATDDPRVNAAVVAEARGAGAWVNSVDGGQGSNLIVPAVLREGGVAVAVATGGASPLLAARLRERLRAVVTPSLGRAAQRLGRLRAEVRSRWPDDGQRRRRFWESLITQEFLEGAIAGRDEEVESSIETCLSRS